MHRAVTIVLTLILFVIGVSIVFTRPWDAAAISIGMFLVAISVLNIAVQIYFPEMPKRPVELKVIESPVTAQEITRIKRTSIKRKKKARRR